MLELSGSACGLVGLPRPVHYGGRQLNRLQIQLLLACDVNVDCGTHQDCSFPAIRILDHDIGICRKQNHGLKGS